jgi:Rod binding domain-containing protein
MIDTAPVTNQIHTGYNIQREDSITGSIQHGPSFSSTLQNSLATMEGRGAALDEHQRLWDTCLEMESLFVSKMLKEMRNSVQKSEWLHGGFAEDVFTDMLYDEYSLQISKNSNLGLARQLYDEMSRNL